MEAPSSDLMPSDVVGNSRYSKRESTKSGSDRKRLGSVGQEVWPSVYVMHGMKPEYLTYLGDDTAAQPDNASVRFAGIMICLTGVPNFTLKWSGTD